MIQLVGVSEAAIEPKVSAAKIYRAVYDGELPALDDNPLTLDLAQVIAWRARKGKGAAIERAVA